MAKLGAEHAQLSDDNCCGIHEFDARRSGPTGNFDPESIVPLPDKFDIELPAPDVPPGIARFHGAWIGTWGDDNRHVLVVERIRPDGHANVVFAHANLAYYNMYREWFRSEATIADGVLTFHATFTVASVTLRFVFDGPDRLYETATYRPEGSDPEHWSAPIWRGLLNTICR